MTARSYLLGGLAMLALGCGDLLGIPDGVSQDGGKSSDAHDAPEVIPGTAAVRVSSGSNFQSWCVVTADGEVDCWGGGYLGMLGNGKSEASTTPVKVVGLPPATDVTVGYEHVCALTRAGTVWCWGYGADGELGNGTTTTVSTTPVQVTGLEDVISVSAGGSYTSPLQYWDGATCAVKRDGLVWCWGGGWLLGNAPAIADGYAPTSSVPTRVVGLEHAKSVSVGLDTACALLQDGRVKCWGGWFGAGTLGNGLGNGTANGSYTPVFVGVKDAVVPKFEAVSVGGGFMSSGPFACALADDGHAWCWGDLSFDGANANVVPSPQPVDGPQTFTAISVGASTACGIDGEGRVFCWGAGEGGSLGTLSGLREGTSVGSGTQGDLSLKPVEVPDLSATSLSIGAAPCAVTRDGGAECWGNTGEVALTPVEVDGVADGPATSVSVGGWDRSSAFACAVSFGPPSRLQCWGADGYGQLGDSVKPTSGDLLQRKNTPQRVMGGAQPCTQVSAGRLGNFACGIFGGSVLCWGENESGQLGDGFTVATATPTRVLHLPDGETALEVSSGINSACALMSEGDVYCWGSDGNGQLGDGNGDAGLIRSGAGPVVLPGKVSAVSAGNQGACAVLADGGEVYCWGRSAFGKLGTGSTSDGGLPPNSTTPQPVELASGTSLTGVASVSVGISGACAVTTAGGIICWGEDYYGQLGDGNAAGYSGCFCSPYAVPSFVSVGATKVDVGFSFVCAIVWGAVKCWGSHLTGNGEWPSSIMNDGTASGAIQVTGLDHGVTDIAVGNFSACAVQDGHVFCWGSNSVGELGAGLPMNDFLPKPVPGFPR